MPADFEPGATVITTLRIGLLYSDQKQQGPLLGITPETHARPTEV
jgi:hypothetical protein